MEEQLYETQDRAFGSTSFGQQQTFPQPSAVLVEKESSTERTKLLEQPEWQLANRIATSKTFSRSEFLPKFLLYVCEQQLAGNTREITEQRIGVDVFQRSPGYNPGEDNIVRNYARLLRKRLAKYFQTEGADEPIQVEIPRGGYIPHFRVVSKIQEVLPAPEDDIAQQSIHLKEPEEAIRPPNSSNFRRRQMSHVWVLALLGFLLGAVSWPAWTLMQTRLFTKGISPAHALWTQLFQKNRNLIIVPADSGVGILQNLTGKSISLDDYASRKYSTDDSSNSGLDPASLDDLRSQRYTSMVDLKITSALLQLPEFVSNRSEIRDTRGMNIEDFKTSNVILLGSVHSNPWVRLFEKSTNFRLEYEREVDSSYVVNQNPVGGEQKIYRNGENNKPSLTYGVIDYLPNLYNNGHVLIIQGLNMASTQAAADILLRGEAIQPVLARAKRPDGSLKKFELLIETTSIGATAPDARIIATRIYP